MTRACQEHKQNAILEGEAVAKEWKARAVEAEAAAAAAAENTARLQERFNGLQKQALEQQRHMRDATGRATVELSAENAKLTAGNAALSEELQLMTTLYDEQQVRPLGGIVWLPTHFGVGADGGNKGGRDGVCGRECGGKRGIARTLCAGVFFLFSPLVCQACPRTTAGDICNRPGRHGVAGLRAGATACGV